jgi:hypothetical protein
MSSSPLTLFAWAFRRGIFGAIFFLIGFCQHAGLTWGQSPSFAPVAVSFTTANRVRVEPGFAGFNVALMDTAINYDDETLAAFAAKVNPGWLRFPAGTRSDAFDWKTGRSHPEWVQRFSGSGFFAIIEDALKTLEAKGGERIDDAYKFAKKAGAQGLIVCVNVFTDTPESAGRLAAYAKQKGIKVLVWQLGNEPTFFPQFFTDATDYANKMRPFADAIRQADPAAPISLSLGLLGRDSGWDDLLAAYTPRYWNVLTYHHYPGIRGGEDQLVAALNLALVDDTTEYIKSHIIPRFGSMSVVISETAPGAPIAPGLNTPGGTTMVGTLYGGLWAAEYALRMSFLPQVKHVGMHQLVGAAGVDLKDSHHADLLAAYKNGTRVDASSLDYRLFVSAQGAAYAVAAQAINSAQFAYPTNVVGGGKARLADDRSPPALYAQAYREQGKWSVVIVNKGAQQESVSISMDGRRVRSQFHLITVTGASPSARNTSMSNEVSPITGTTTAVIPVPARSVVLAKW